MVCVYNGTGLVSLDGGYLFCKCFPIPPIRGWGREAQQSRPAGCRHTLSDMHRPDHTVRSVGYDSLRTLKPLLTPRPKGQREFLKQQITGRGLTLKTVYTWWHANSMVLNMWGRLAIPFQEDSPNTDIMFRGRWGHTWLVQHVLQHECHKNELRGSVSKLDTLHPRGLSKN